MMTWQTMWTDLQYGSSDRDKEYFIPDDEDLDDE